MKTQAKPTQGKNKKGRGAQRQTTDWCADWYNQQRNSSLVQLRQAVFGNVGTMMSFRIGAEDAPLVANELGLKNAEVFPILPISMPGSGLAGLITPSY